MILEDFLKQNREGLVIMEEKKGLVDEIKEENFWSSKEIWEAKEIMETLTSFQDHTFIKANVFVAQEKYNTLDFPPSDAQWIPITSSKSSMWFVNWVWM